MIARAVHAMLDAAILFALAGAAALEIGCTPAARATAGTVIADVGAAAPLVCQLVPTTGASVCGTVTADVSAVARLIASILASLPPAMAATAAPQPAGVGVVRYHGCDIVLPPGVSAAAVAKALP